MKQHLFAFVIFVCLLCRINPDGCHAQILERDSIKADSRYPDILFSTNPYIHKPQKIDTSLLGISQYLPLFGNGTTPLLYLSNIGQASAPLVFTYKRRIGFDNGWHAYDPYLTTPDSVRYFSSPYPFSEVKYCLGTGSEQFLTADLSIPIKKIWHLNLQYRLLSTEGEFGRQATSLSHFYTSLNYRDQRQRYQMLAHIILNRVENEQNGGVWADALINDDTLNLITDTLTKPKTILEPKLGTAQDYLRSRRFLLQQTFDGGIFYKDTITLRVKNHQAANGFEERDTILTRLFTTRRIGHSIAYETFKYRYEDEQLPNYSAQQGSSLFPFPYPAQTYLNTAQTKDSTSINLLQNEVFGIILGKKRADSLQKQPFVNTFNLQAGLQHQFVWANRLASIDTVFQGVDTTLRTRDTLHRLQTGIIYGRFQNSTDSRLHYNAELRYALWGYNLADIEARAQLHYLLSKKIGGIRAQTVFQNLEAPYLAQQYRSNHFSWDNNLRKIQSLLLQGTYYNPQLRLELTYSNYTFTNYVVWNEAAVPQQLEKPINISLFTVRHTAQWRRWHLNNTLTVQLVSDNDWVRLPVFVGRHQLYYQRQLFGSAALLQAGIDIYENTNYMANAYMPVTGQFYLQNQEKLSFYPVVDVFVHFKVKRARLFVRMRHVNQGLMGKQKGYFVAPGYAAFDRYFNFGVSWMFYD